MINSKTSSKTVDKEKKGKNLDRLGDAELPAWKEAFTTLYNLFKENIEERKLMDEGFEKREADFLVEYNIELLKKSLTKKKGNAIVRFVGEVIDLNYSPVDIWLFFCQNYDLFLKAKKIESKEANDMLSNFKNLWKHYTKGEINRYQKLQRELNEKLEPIEATIRKSRPKRDPILLPKPTREPKKATRPITTTNTTTTTKPPIVAKKSPRSFPSPDDMEIIPIIQTQTKPKLPFREPAFIIRDSLVYDKNTKMPLQISPDDFIRGVARWSDFQEGRTRRDDDENVPGLFTMNAFHQNQIITFSEKDQRMMKGNPYGPRLIIQDAFDFVAYKRTPYKLTIMEALKFFGNTDDYNCIEMEINYKGEIFHFIVATKEIRGGDELYLQPEPSSTELKKKIESTTHARVEMKPIITEEEKSTYEKSKKSMNLHNASVMEQMLAYMS
jgi:hypothetical protein